MQGRPFDSGTCDSIPLVVNDVPADTTFKILDHLKTISNNLEQFKDESRNSSDTQQDQINILTETVQHLLKQNNDLREMTLGLQKSLRILRKDIHGQKDKKRSERNTLTRGADQAENKDTSTPDLKQLAHLEEALQENFTKFVENLSFSSTSVPDKLQESDCLSDEECSVIRSKHDKDQVRHLLLKLMTRGPKKIFTFLQIMREQDTTGRSLAESVFESVKRIENDVSKEGIKCIVCYMKRNVDLRDIGDYLFQSKLISREIYGIILEPSAMHANKTFIWSSIINSVNKSDNFDISMDHLLSALKGKYQFLVDHLINQRITTTSLDCLCSKERKRSRKGYNREFGSQTDISASSFIPKFSEVLSEDSFTEPDSSSPLSSLEMGDSYASLLKYKRISVGPCDSTTQENSEKENSARDIARQGSYRFDIEHLADETDDGTQISDRDIDTTVGNDRPSYVHSVSEISIATLCEADQDESVDPSDENDNTKN